MRSFYIVMAAVLVTGCTTQHRTPVATAAPGESRPIMHEATPTHTVETRYEIRGYRDGNDATVRHEAHAVYRMTRVRTRMAALEIVPRAKFPPISHAPLPASDELSAEIASQKHITGELHAIQSSMATVEQQAKTQYRALVTQTAETIKLRKELEEERAQVRALEARLRSSEASVPAASRPPPIATTSENRW